MKIASIGMQARGGAGLSSLKLHREFVKNGHDAKFFVAKNSPAVEGVELIPNISSYNSTWWRLGTMPLKDGVHNIVSSGFSGKSADYLQNVYKWSDVVLLRWITSTVSDWQVGRWSTGPKPVVWCLSDMAPFTGGCHYSQGCTKYEVSCTQCAMVSNEFSNVPSLVVERRKNIWKKITVVSPSRWLANCAKNSAIFHDMDIRVIRTGVELDVFKSVDRYLARAQLGLDPDGILLFFGAHSAAEERKGFDILPSVIEILRSQGYGEDQLKVLVVGGEPNAKIKSMLPCISLGRVDDRDRMAIAYSAADITVLPYREDNLPNVMLESISCGTPVCAFDIGGMPDVIVPGVNGYLAVPFDAWDMAACIRTLIEDPLSQQSIRSWAQSNIGLSKQASEYLSLFEGLTKK